MWWSERVAFSLNTMRFWAYSNKTSSWFCRNYTTHLAKNAPTHLDVTIPPIYSYKCPIQVIYPHAEWDVICECIVQKIGKMMCQLALNLPTIHNIFQHSFQPWTRDGQFHFWDDGVVACVAILRYTTIYFTNSSLKWCSALTLCQVWWRCFSLRSD